MIDVKQPVVVAVPLDDTTEDVVRAAVSMARAFGVSLVPVHALTPWLFPTARRSPAEAEAAKEEIRKYLVSAAEIGVPVVDPIVEESEVTGEVLDVARRTHAQLLVVGQGTGPTVGRWLLGSVADRLARSATCPVLVARGTFPGPDRPVVCPVDLSPHSRLGFVAALRMARLFGAKVRVVTVVPPSRSQGVDAIAIEAQGIEEIRRAVADLCRAEDTAGVDVEILVRAGSPSTVLLEECDRGGLTVVASRAFDMMVPASFGNVTSRVVRGTRSSVLCVRDMDEAPERRERRVKEVTRLRSDAQKALARGDLETAERSLRFAGALLPGQPVIDEELAAVLEKAGRREEAERRRALAKILRASHD